VIGEAEEKPQLGLKFRSSETPKRNFRFWKSGRQIHGTTEDGRGYLSSLLRRDDYQSIYPEYNPEYKIS
jgi:hypothetical protein